MPARKARKATEGAGSTPAPLYHPPGSLTCNKYGSWMLYWRTPERKPDGSVHWRQHGKTVAKRGISRKEARKRADKFLAGLKIPLVEHVAIEQARKEVAAVLARPGHGAVTAERPEPPKLNQIIFDPPSLYLLDTSQGILGEYMLSKLTQVANLRKAVAEMQGALATATAEAMLGQWLTHNRETLLDTFRRLAGEQQAAALPNRAQAIIAEMAQRLLGPGQPKRKTRKAKRLLGISH